MACYVDELRRWGAWKWGDSCHLTADSLAELHAFAMRIGMRRSWFQDTRYPHYDLTAARRARAIRCGAIETTARARVLAMRPVVAP